MNPVTYTHGVTAAGNVALIVASNTPAGAGNLALVGGGTVTLDVPRKVLVTFGNEAANRTVKITGTNLYKNIITETLTIASGAGGTIGTVQDFLTVTQVTVAAAFTAAMSVGTQSAGQSSPVRSTPWLEIGPGLSTMQLNFGVNAAAFTTGYLIEVTFDDPNAGYEGTPFDMTVPESIEPRSNVPPFAFPEPVNFGAYPGTKKTTNFTGTMVGAYFAVRGTQWDTSAIQFQFMLAGHLGT